MRFLVTALSILSLLACSPAPTNSASIIEKTALKKVATEQTFSHPQEFKDLNFDRIRRLMCWNDSSKGRAIGTAWVIKQGILVTAAHVADQHCIDTATNLPVKAYYVDWDNDIALMAMATGPVADVMEINCDGFIPGERYSAIGYAGGTRFRETRLIATGVHADEDSKMRMSPTHDVYAIHLAHLYGKIYHGMSGGPIINEEGIVVGINSTTDEAYDSSSRELRDTILCGAPRRNPAGKAAEPFTNIPDVKTE
jgi:S1-C subfamily serine protease